MKGIVFLTLLTFLVIVSGCTNQTPYNQSSDKSVPDDSQDFSRVMEICNKIFLDRDRDECYSDLAAASKNVSICNDLLNGSEYCIALATGNYTFCEQVVNTDYDAKSSCYIEFAFKTRDPSVCNVLDYQYVKDSCNEIVAKVTDNPGLCDIILDPIYKSYCYMDTGIYTENQEICDKINGNEYSDLKDQCYSVIGVKKKDLEICDKIQDPDEKAWCYGVILNDTSKCAGIQDSYLYDVCYLKIAEKTNDSSLCEKPNNYGALCYAVVENDPTQCRSPPYLHEKDCYELIIKRVNRTDVCDPIENMYTRSDCYVVFADVLLKRNRYP